MDARGVLICIALGALGLQAQTVRVPFVGCESSSQTGFLKAPKGATRAIQGDARMIRELAHYEAANGLSVLAPKGWQCFGTSGSSGAELLVLSRPITAADWSRTTSPAVHVEDLSGETSGRFEVAEVIARVFPARRAFVQGVLAMFDLPASTYTYGPYPDDKLIVRNDRLVQFQTPPRAEGLGTMSRLKANDDPIDGVATLEGKTPDLLMLRVRLPRELRTLTSIIIDQVQREHR
jgi:hypothetical protein